MVTTLDKYSEKVGLQVGEPRWFDIDQIRIDTFASVTGDRQFIHVDEEAAAKRRLELPLRMDF